MSMSEGWLFVNLTKRDIDFLIKLARKSAQTVCSSDKESERLAEKSREFLKRKGLK